VDKFAKSKKRHGKGSVKAEKEKALKSVVKAGRGVTVVGKKNEKATDKAKVSNSKKLKL
jgi:U3 small nucleolar RNA-associated protein MPP10